MTRHLVSFFAGALLTASSFLYAQSGLLAGLVDGADFFFYYDPQGVITSEFSQAIEANQTAEEKAAAENAFAEFNEATGLEEDDFLSMVFSMDLDGIDFESQDPAQLETAKALLALELDKAVTLEQVKAALEAMGEKTEGPVPTMEISEIDGLEVLSLTGTETPGGVDKAYATVSEDGKTVLLSFNTLSLADGLNRISTQTAAEPSADMAVAQNALGDNQIRIALVLPESARGMIQEGVQGAAAQGGMGAMFMPFAGTKSLLVAINASESLDVALSLDLGDEGNAQQAAGMIQSFLPMMMMGMQQQLGPEAMTLAQKLKIGPEGSVVSAKIQLLPEDIEMFPDMPTVPMME